jgi:hypothetical protein
MSLEDLSLEQRDELALLAKQLSDNPSTRKEFLRMTKQVRPELSVPELDIEDYTNKKVSAAEERVMALESKLRERDAVEELNKRRARLGRSEEEVAEIEKVMLEQGVTNHETAAQYFDWMKQAATPTPMGYSSSPMNKFNLEKYWKNPQMGARDEAQKALMELKNQNSRPIGFK